MEESPKNGKESSHSAYAERMNELKELMNIYIYAFVGTNNE